MVDEGIAVLLYPEWRELQPIAYYAEQDGWIKGFKVGKEPNVIPITHLQFVNGLLFSLHT